MTAITDSRALDALKQYFGYEAFRPGQSGIVGSIIAGRDVLGVMPTGAGKSVCYQIPATILPGVAIVISPLISLMRDQVDALNDAGIPAAFINTTQTPDEQSSVFAQASAGFIKLLYVAPERLETERFRNFASRTPISLVAVDEAHCVSQWGQDFRSSYLGIGEFIANLPARPTVAAFTATATERVRHDIVSMLGLRDPDVTVTGFDRPNLYFDVIKLETKHKAFWVAKYVAEHADESGIVYCATRKETEALAASLNHAVAELRAADGADPGQAGPIAVAYHGGMSPDVRERAQRDFVTDRVPVVVATNAFGMGIDKPDVRIVIHLDLPDSPEAYFQEAGRAGRDGNKAYAVILYAKSDKVTLHKRIPDTFPEKDYIKQVYEHLQYYYQMAMGDGLGCVREFNLEDFCRKFKYFPVPADSALKILTQAGYLEYTDEQDNASRLYFTVRRDELYKLRELGEDMDKLIQIVLRSYTGVFTDYTFINENSLAVRSGLTRQRVYDLLIRLSKMRVIDYIPHKKTPYIIYTRERVDRQHLQIFRSIYEERKERYEARIQAMVDYVTTETVCRSRMLLRYFGEKNEHNCGICDVCLSHRAETPELSSQQIKEEIKELLCKQPLTPADIASQIEADKEIISQCIRELLEDEVLKAENGIISLKA